MHGGQGAAPRHRFQKLTRQSGPRCGRFWKRSAHGGAGWRSRGRARGRNGGARRAATVCRPGQPAGPEPNSPDGNASGPREAGMSRGGLSIDRLQCEKGETAGFLGGRPGRRQREANLGGCAFIQEGVPRSDRMVSPDRMSPEPVRSRQPSRLITSASKNPVRHPSSICRCTP